MSKSTNNSNNSLNFNPPQKPWDAVYQAVNAVSSELPPLSSSSIRNFINSVRIDSRRILSRDLQSTGENDQETTIDNRARYLDELVRKRKVEDMNTIVNSTDLSQEGSGDEDIYITTCDDSVNENNGMVRKAQKTNKPISISKRQEALDTSFQAALVAYSDEEDYGEGVRRTKPGVEGCAGSSTSFVQPDNPVNE
ncbi:hypothetical protein G6F33_010940 [Rhizopus arrhizus]|nr:hypothetical protein G6F24_009972 [Rhizopus arrhizus]KAG0906998.1 hypothetical protein G6F33_010940 [Rhizopus arrhizus]